MRASVRRACAALLANFARVLDAGVMSAAYASLGFLGPLLVAGCSFSGAGVTVPAPEFGTTDGATGETDETGGVPATVDASDGGAEAGGTQATGPAAPTTSADGTTLEVGATEVTGEDATTDVGTEDATGEGSTSTGECDLKPWYVDMDGDGVGVDTQIVMACERPRGYAGEAGDCDDNDGLKSPDTLESCDSKDNDCDEVVDEYSEINTNCGGCDLAVDSVEEPTRAYYFCQTALAWSAARGGCESKGAQLSSDEEQDEHAFINARIEALAANVEGWWLGGHYETGLAYSWLSGSQIANNDDRWAGVHLVLVGHCITLDDNGEWQARVCEDKQAYVCEAQLP